MPVFIRLIRFTDVGLDAVSRNSSEVAAKTLGAIHAVGAKVIGAFVTLGAYDVVSMLEAKDDEQVARVDEAIAALGYYITIEQAGAVALSDFVELSKSAPVFVTAWVQGRRALPFERKLQQASTDGAARAASSARSRTKGVDERKIKREPGGAAFVAWLGAEGPLPVRDYSVVMADGSLTFSLLLPASSEAAAELKAVERGGPVKGLVFGVVADKSRTPIPAVLCRMDTQAEGAHDIALKAVLPKALFDRVASRSQAARPAKK